MARAGRARRAGASSEPPAARNSVAATVPSRASGLRASSNTQSRVNRRELRVTSSVKTHMSIPRIAIERPVTMFMISMVIILLGAISLTRLPVDLMPDMQMPTITVRANYAGVGPLEMEELATRPIEQAVIAVAGLERVVSSSSEGNANIRLNFVWGTDLAEAADEVRTRLDRVRGRLPEDADPPTVFKFDSTAMPIMGIGVGGDFDPVTLREIAQNDLSPRLERVAGVAAVTANGGLRRQIRVDLSRAKISELHR